MAKIYHAHLYGLREDKYKTLSENTINSTQFLKLNPQSEFYLFIPQDTDLFSEYEQYFKITDIMPVNSVGIVTARDKLTIQNTPEKVWQIVNDFVGLDVETAREKYNLSKDSQDWKINLAQEDLKSSQVISSQNQTKQKLSINLKNNSNNFNLDPEKITPILYRPFDLKYTYYTGNSGGFICRPRPEVMKNMLLGDNLGLVSCRQQSQKTIWNLCSITNTIIESCAVSNKTKEIGSLFPLYLYPETDKPQELQQEKRANFTQEFLNKIETKLGYLPTPEAIFYYIYGVFHSPTYRSRYAEFLKIDFPRVPLTSNNQLFTELSAIGEQLVQLHLMTSPKLDNLITKFVENGGNREAKIGSAETAWIDGIVKLNNKDYFTGISEEVWNFYIGGYQVSHKWLKDRKGRTLSDDDILHYQKIVIALSETIKLMTLIDETIPSFPIE